MTWRWTCGEVCQRARRCLLPPLLLPLFLAFVSLCHLHFARLAARCFIPPPSPVAGCILAEMLNKLRGKVTLYKEEQQAYIYAIFPVDHHMDHLQTIMKIIGPPSLDVLRATTDARIQNVVQREVRRTPDSAAECFVVLVPPARPSHGLYFFAPPPYPRSF